MRVRLSFARLRFLPASLQHFQADFLIALALTALAAVLRLWDLGGIPQGVHGDEAQFGVDAQRVLSEGWIGPYTTSALGQPSGIAYVIAPGQWLFGATALGARFSVALFAIAAIPLAYVLFRMHTTRFLAATAAFLLAVSLWHIHFSRVAYQPALVPTVALAVLVLWTLAMQRGNWHWFALAGGVIGLGIYTYTVYPIFVVAFSVFVAVYTLVYKRGDEFWPWARKVGLAAGISFVVALPLFLYILNPDNDFFSHYRGYYSQYSVLQSDAFQEASFAGRVDVVFDQVKRFIGAYAWEGVTDFVDAASPDGRPMFDRLSLLLVGFGFVLAALRWREPVNLMAITMLAIIPLASVLQTNSTYRGPLGTVPFVVYFMALGLTWTWDRLPRLQDPGRLAGYAAIAGIVAVLAYVNVQTYFGNWAQSSTFRWVYTQEISEASLYVESLPGQPYVYFYSGRWSFHYETRQYLAPDAAGEDRSAEFGSVTGYEVDRGRDSLILLLPPYTNELGEVLERYPDGEVYTGSEDGRVLFHAVRVPAGP